jgi:uncharacterized protein (TIGR02145 family)
MKLTAILTMMSILSLTLHTYSPARTRLGTFTTSAQDTLWYYGLSGGESGTVELPSGISAIRDSSKYSEKSSGSNGPSILVGVVFGTLILGTIGAYIGYTTYNQKGIGIIEPTVTGGILGAVAGGIIGYAITSGNGDDEESGVSQEPIEEESTIIVEYGGKSYHSVQIGNQCWLKENLDIGTMIQGIDTSKDNGIIEKYCYNNDTTYCNIYGGLYQWNETMQYSTVEGTQGLCPPGWHVPTYIEYQTLKTVVGDDGNSLKALWQGTGNVVGTNASGYSALLAGFRSINGDFLGLSSTAAFWSALEYNPTDAYIVDLGFNHDGIYLRDIYKTYGFSVRCLRD